MAASWPSLCTTVEATPELLVCLDVAAAFIDEADNEVADTAEVIEAFAVDEAVAIVAELCRLASCCSMALAVEAMSSPTTIEEAALRALAAAFPLLKLTF